MQALPDRLMSRGGDPTLLRDELLHLIREQIDNHPRSQQRRIGPSEIGTPCTRRLAYKLAGVEEVNPSSGAWRPTVGTAVHTWLEAALQSFNNSGFDRFYLEEKVTVGSIGGVDITGSCDVYDRCTATVIDWKVVGPDRIKRYRLDGPGDQYRTQAHLYGRGFTTAGLPVDHVAVMFLPANGELRDAHYWTEPYDESIALAGLTRANGVAALIALGGAAAAAALPTSDAYCRYCPFYSPGSTDLTTACPGDTSRTAHTAPATLAAALT